MQRIILKTDKNKVEVVSILKLNTESWHKDGSTIPLEGKIDDDGNFSLKPAWDESVYRQEDAGIRFIGQISEENKLTVIHIKLKIQPSLLVFYILLLSFGIAMSVYTCFTSSVVGAKRFLIFIPCIVVAVVFAIKYYYTYKRVKNKTLELIKILVS